MTEPLQGAAASSRWRRAAHWGVVAAALGLFAWLFTRVDLAGVVTQIVAIGATGFAAIIALYALEFYADVLAWQLLLPARRGGRLRWSAVLYRVRLLGEAMNVLTPLGGMGGEPVKAMVLKQRHGVTLSLGSASLVLAKTVNVVALTVFLLVGFQLMLDDPRIDALLRLSALTGLLLLAAGILGFVAVQIIGIGRVLAWLGATRSARLRGLLQTLVAFDAHMSHGYRGRPGAVLAALVLGMANWILGALSVQVGSMFMGHPLSFTDAWIIEAMTQMVRAGAFFIPAGLGAQEGIQMLVVSTLTGRPDLGLALALVRRGRELLWLLLGLAAGWGHLPETPRR
jgi:uncharacterized protein (TIRG00374 family)